MTKERWSPSFRCISALYPSVSVYDRIAASHADFLAAIAIEQRTNPRIREEAGDLRKIRPADFISGKGTTPIIAPFAYAGPSRFCDGTYGVYYAARSEETAIAESLYHTQQRLRESREPSIDVDKCIYTSTIAGRFDDLRAKSMRSRLYDRDDYSASQAYGRRLYAQDDVDGIVYNSVRHVGGQCMAVFRPKNISDAKIRKYVQFRWDGTRIVGYAKMTEIRRYQ